MKIYTSNKQRLVVMFKDKVETKKVGMKIVKKSFVKIYFPLPPSFHLIINISLKNLFGDLLNECLQCI